MARTISFAAGDSEYTVPATWTICQRCGGEGHHGNPAFDGMAYPGDSDPEFWEGYFAGRYDVRCDECQGEGKVLAADEQAMSAAQRAAYEQHLQAEAADRYERMLAARYGW